MKTIKKSLAFILVLTMIFALCAPALAEAAPEKYVYIGDSMTFNFGSRHGWCDNVKKIYPEQAAEKFGYTIDAKFAKGGIRTTDLYYLISDYEGDDYTHQQFPSDNPESKAAYQQSIKDASVISMQLGYSNISVELLANILNILGLGGMLGGNFSYDMDQVFSKEEIARTLPYAEKCAELVQKFLDSDTVAAIKASVKENISDANRAKLSELLGEDILEVIDKLSDYSGELSKALVYAVTADLVHFDRSVDCIKKLNDSADLYVIGLFNPADYLKASVTVGGIDVVIPLGEMIGAIFEMFNLYMRVFSPYSDQYYFVENVKHAETYAELMPVDADVTYDVVYSILDGKDGAIRRFDATRDAITKQLVPGVMKLVSNKTFDITAIINSISSDLLDSISDLNDEALINLISRVVQLDENGELTSTAFEQALAHIYIMQALKGIYVHPTQAGHDAVAERLIAAMENPTVDPMAKAFHEKENQSELRDSIKLCDSIDEILASTVDWLNDNDPGDDSLFSFINQTVNSITTTLLGFVRIIRSFLQKLSWIF